MEDRYLYKAKTTPKEKGEFNNVWVTGNLIVSNEKYYIHPVGNVVNVKSEIGRIIVMHEVIPDTICQCTGLKDKNGELIWENDILHNGNYFVVKWNESCSRFDIVLNNSNNIPIGKWEPMICDWKTSDFKEYRKAVDYEVVGNVFDNPELLESEEK